MKNICFVANYYKTVMFLKISKKLESHNITTFWIVPSKKQFDELAQEIPKERLLYIGKKEVLSNISNNEKFDLKIHEIIFGDRVLKTESKKWAYNYLLNLQGLYYNFIKSNEITAIFGEVTWGHELILKRLTEQATELKCKYLLAQSVRIPNERFAFFNDEYESSIEEPIIKHNELSDSKIVKIEKPTYLAILDNLLKKESSLKSHSKKLKNFILRTNQDSNDPTLFSNSWLLFKIRIKERYNRVVFKTFVTEFNYEDLPKDKKYILFTLHKQPEASIDTIGRYFEDQKNLITNIWRILPENYILLVKEHSNAIGDRNLTFYNYVKNLRNTILIHHKIDSHKLLDICEAVFTVSGTIGYEAALKGKKAFTFGPVYFNKLNYCKRISWKEFRETANLNQLLQTIPKENNIQEFSDWLYSNSFEGIMTDSFTEPICAEEENITKLYNAFLTILK